MPSFGTSSKKKLAMLHPDLQAVLCEAIKHVDFTIVCGYRDKAEQDKAVAEGNSKTPWPTSKHNANPSDAVDVAPWVNGVIWDDEEAFTLLAGIIKGIAFTMGIKLRVGIDWDGDMCVKEHSFKDRPHIERIP